MADEKMEIETIDLCDSDSGEEGSSGRVAPPNDENKPSCYYAVGNSGSGEEGSSSRAEQASPRHGQQEPLGSGGPEGPPNDGKEASCFNFWSDFRETLPAAPQTSPLRPSQSRMIKVNIPLSKRRAHTDPIALLSQNPKKSILKKLDVSQPSQVAAIKVVKSVRFKRRPTVVGNRFGKGRRGMVQVKKEKKE